MGFAECVVNERIARWSPARTPDFSPTWSAAECGVNGNADPMKSCKDDTNTNDDLRTYNIRSFFQNSLVVIAL
ncbi:hypothetical protein Barb4_04622 [Bacteroidales bacterium Barb4]|nr:hypothetical protein Barb4_04622 [Bacteroidales bacterium Barb4]